VKARIKEFLCGDVMNKKNITTIVLVSLAMFIYMVFLGTLIEDVR